MVKNQLFSSITQNTVVNQGLVKNVKIEDAEKPLFYKEWLHRSRLIKHGFEYEEYNKYLARWNQLKTKKTELGKKIKDDYKSFIRSLTLFFDDDMKRRFNDDFDLDDMLNLEEIIPHCAEKLRDIMVYYQNKRDAIKRAKLKYNLVGTYTSIERMLHEYILKAFTKHGKYIKLSDKKLYEILPELGDVNNSLEIKIDELYDDTEYMDKSPAMDAVSVPYDGEYGKSYFGTLSDEAIQYYSQYGYSNPEEINWLIGNGFSGVVGDNIIAEIADESASDIEAAIQKLTNLVNNTGTTNDLPSSAYVDFDKTNTIEYYQKRLTKKYLGEDQYLVSGGYYVNEYVDLVYDLEAGNNWISFPSGEGDFEKPKIKIKPLALSATTLVDNEKAIGSKTYVNADKIFIRYGNEVEGAWLRDVSVDHSDKTMICNMYANHPFSFRFPYSDFGLSGEGIEWSGPGIDNSDQTIYTLPEADRNGIMKAYWEKTGEKSCNAIALNRTTLVDCGAVADVYYGKADKITVREGQNTWDSNPNGVYTGEKYEAYLYKVLSSDLPILPKRNYIKWPYQNTTVDGLIGLPADGCEDVCLTAESWRRIPGSRAGYNLFDSDIIYKLDAPDGNPVECAYLSGVPFTNLSAISDWNTTTWTDNATGCFQTGRYTRCLANNYVSFIWLDEDTPMDEVVFHIEHSPDCPYLAEQKYSLYELNPESNDEEATGITFKEWQKCSCGAIRYSPLGHPGKKFEDYNGFADCCFVDNTHPIPFDKNIWFGDDGNTGNSNYMTSMDFGWYQLTGKDQVEPDVGWGKGRWVAGGNADGALPFILRRGKQYKYFRNGIGHGDNDILNGTMPPLVITHKHSKKVMDIVQPKWMRAVMDADGQWQPTKDPSYMIIRADDNIVYDHIDTEWWCITGNNQVTTWTTVEDIVPKIDYSDYLNFVQYNVVPVSSYVVDALWPNISPTNNMSQGKYCTLPTKGQIDLVKWHVDYSGVGIDNVDKIMPVEEPLFILSTVTGDVSVSATGYSNLNAQSNGVYSFDETYRAVDGATAAFTVHFMGQVTATHTSSTTDVYTVSAETIGFPLNIRLNGWDYDTRKPSTTATKASANGARPIWVEASNKSDSITHDKAIDKWGGGLRFTEEYVPIMQPKISEITLSAFSPITYETSNSIRWVQPIEIKDVVQDRRWCKLYIDDEKKHVLAESELANPNFMEIVSSATDETSDMVLESTVYGNDVTINYWANQPFTWKERVVDITRGEAPSGGVYTPVSVNKYVDANIECANLSNRHYPTVAVAPFVDNFYGKEDSGGYFVPQYLGASVAISRNTKTTFDETRDKADDNQLVNDFNTYSKDSGLSVVDNNVPVKYDSSYVGWMKSPILDGMHAGFIRKASENQQFMPYKTAQEFRNGMNDLGIGRNNDITDPWRGTNDLVWRRELYDKHFTGQIPIAAVRKSYMNTDEIKTWTHDIYGYSYGLLKKDLLGEVEYKSKFNKERFNTGVLYVRRSDGIIDKLENYLTCLKLKDNEFYSLDMFYDTLILIGKERVVLYKLVFDSNANAGYSIVDDSSNRIVIDLSGNFLNEFSAEIENECDIQIKCAGTWKFAAKSCLDIIYLAKYDYRGKSYYSYIIETIDMNTFVRKHHRLSSRTLELLNLDDPGVEFSVKRFSGVAGEGEIAGRYFMIGPFIDYLDGFYTFVFQLRGDGTTNDKVGRFVRTVVNTSNYKEKWEMVRKIDFTKDGQ